MTINHDNIDTALDRFFDGDTTCAEDKALQLFFTTQPVPLRLKKYIPMFQWYADGMTEPQVATAPAPRKPKAIRWIAGAAAAIAVVISAGWNISTTPAPTVAASIYEGSYTEVNNIIITDMNLIKDDIELTQLEARRIELELQAAEKRAEADIAEAFS